MDRPGRILSFAFRLLSYKAPKCTVSKPVFRLQSSFVARIKPEWIQESYRKRKSPFYDSWVSMGPGYSGCHWLTAEVNLEDYDLSRWRLMHIGGATCSASLIKRWKKNLSSSSVWYQLRFEWIHRPWLYTSRGIENIHKVGAIGIPGHNLELK